MNCIITDTAEYTLSLLRDHPRGMVHSVYRKTVNLLLKPAAAGNSCPEAFHPEQSGTVPQPGTALTQPEVMPGQGVSPEKPLAAPRTREVLVALQASGSPLSPVSLITELSEEQMASLPIQAGMEVCVRLDAESCGRAVETRVYPDADPGRPAWESLSEDKRSAQAFSLFVGPQCTFHIRAEHPADLCLRYRLPCEELVLLEQRIAEALAMRDAGSFELLFTAPEKASGILFLPVAQKRLEETRDALARKAFSEAAGSLTRLIGLGPGLTPAGDDFLCGVLAGLTLCGQDMHPFALALRKEIAGRLGDTNKISAAFLACALENQFSQAVNELRLCYPATKLLHIFREIGHSSGTDSLCGVLFILLFRRLF